MILLGATILVVTLFHTVRLPPIVAFITAGIAIGPYGLKLVNATQQVETLTEAAAVLLMFTIGLELSLKELQNFRRPMLILGLGQILLTILLFSLTFWMGFSMPVEKAIFLSLLAAPSSTAVILKLLYDNREFDTPYGRAGFSILFLQDIAVIPMIVIIPILVSRVTLTASILNSLWHFLLLLCIVIVAIYAINRYALPFLLHRVSKTQNREIFFFTIVFICVGSAALMRWAGLSVSLGAFIAGMLLAGSHYGKQATAEILPLRNSFMSLFFVSIGMMMDVRFVLQHFHQIFLIGLVTVAVKTLLLFVIVWLTGSVSGVARAVAALLFQFGEFSFILAELGVQQHLMSEKERQFFVAIAIVTLALTPFLYARLPWIMNSPFWKGLLPEAYVKKAYVFREQVLKLFTRPVDMNEIQREKPIEDHVIIIGYGVAGQILSRVLQHKKIPFRIIEMNAETVRLNAHKLPIVYGDAANSELLLQAGLERARLVVAVTTGVHMLAPILHTISQIRNDVPVLARTNYLLDLKKLSATPNMKFIVSEMESSLSVVESALKEFGCEPTETENLVASLRAEFAT